MSLSPVATNPDDPYVRDRIAAVAPFDRVEFARTFEHRVVHLDSVRIHYVVGGTGPVILFGHGWPASWYEWRKVLPLLADRFTCVAIDLPGFGDSSPPPAFDDATVAGIVKQFIDEELGLEEVFVVCHDISGPPLIYMAAHYPGLVSRLFITETSIDGPEMGKILAEHINEIWHFPVNASHLTASFVVGRERQIVPQFFTDWVYNTAAITPDDIDEYVRVNSRPGATECGAAYYSKAPSVAPGEPTLPKGSLSMPLKYVGASHGFGGYLGGDEKAAFATIDRFATDSEYEVLDKCSHWVSEDRPVTIAERIGEFFGR